MYWELNSLFYFIKVAPFLISIGNLLLLTIILYINWGIKREIQSKSRSMMIFFIFFLGQNLLFAGYFILNIPNNFNMVIAPLVFLCFEFIALILLLKVTRDETKLVLENGSFQLH